MYDPSMRVLTVLELLQARERVTGPELARRLEVSPRTVQRYVARLQDLGIPVEATRGVGGSYRLAPGFHLPPLMFGDEEALALALGLRALKRLGLNTFVPAAEAATAKLERVLPHAVRERVRDVEAAVQLDVSQWVVQTSGAAVLGLAAAVRARQPVAFDYRSRTGSASRREVEPYGLVHQNGRWYLVGHCRSRAALRSFRLDRLAELTPLEGSFTPPDGFDAHAYLNATLPFAEARHRVEVWLAWPLEKARGWLADEYMHLDTEGAGTLVRCSRDHLEPLAALLLTLDCEVDVRGPPELREVFARMALRAQQMAERM